MRRLTTFCAIASSTLMAIQPAFAGGGHAVACYEPVHEPAQYGTALETVLTRPAQTVYQHVPAQYGYKTREILVEPARTVIDVIPARYGTVAKTVIVEPARHITRSSPPVYDIVHEKVLVSPEHITHEWRIIHGKRVLCKIVVPAKYAVQARQVVVKAGHSWTETIPARYATQHETVLLEPEQHIERLVPPVTRTIREKALIEPERSIARTIPAEYATRERHVKLREARQGWHQVDLRGAC